MELWQRAGCVMQHVTAGVHLVIDSISCELRNFKVGPQCFSLVRIMDVRHILT